MALYRCGGEVKNILPLAPMGYIRNNGTGSLTSSHIDYTAADFVSYSAPLDTTGSKRYGWMLVNPQELDILEFTKDPISATLTVKALKKGVSHTVETLQENSNHVVTISQPSKYDLVFASVENTSTSALSLEVFGA